jgi:pyruvate carboxylase subunit B
MGPLLSVCEAEKTTTDEQPDLSHATWKGNGEMLKIQDNTFRDGHQSLFATRMRTEDMIPLAEEMDLAGFWAMEVWGGATFDTMHRFLGEDPWDRPKRLKQLIRKTPLSMLLRGQNLVGYRNYSDDVVRAFVQKACDAGIDIFRIFDALNDFRNFQTSVEVVKANGKHFQGAICYSLTERRMGGEVYHLQYYLDKSKRLEDMGADSICIKDMAGLISPYDAFKLVGALKKTVRVPIHLHTHATSGMATMSYLKAVEAGVDILDCCLAPLALRTSQPAVEPLVAALYGTKWETDLDLKLLLKLSRKLEPIAQKYRDLMDMTHMAPIDVGVLEHQIPGGMISNLVSQLRENNNLHRLDEVLGEIPKTRAELGTPPLVTPTSQIVGVQAVLNVIFGRYQMVSNQVKDLCFGLYGETPTPIDEEMKKKTLKGYKRGQASYYGRPADILPPELEEARKAIGELARTQEDLLLYALYPTTGKEFLQKKYSETQGADT